MAETKDLPSNQTIIQKMAVMHGNIFIMEGSTPILYCRHLTCDDILNHHYHRLTNVKSAYPYVINKTSVKIQHYLCALCETALINYEIISHRLDQLELGMKHLVAQLDKAELAATTISK